VVSELQTALDATTWPIRSLTFPQHVHENFLSVCELREKGTVRYTYIYIYIA